MRSRRERRSPIPHPGGTELAPRWRRAPTHRKYDSVCTATSFDVRHRKHMSSTVTEGQADRLRVVCGFGIDRLRVVCGFGIRIGTEMSQNRGLGCPRIESDPELGSILTEITHELNRRCSRMRPIYINSIIRLAVSQNSNFGRVLG